VTNEVITKVIGDSVRYAISSRLFAARAMTAQCMPSSCVRPFVCLSVCMSQVGVVLKRKYSITLTKPARTARSRGPSALAELLVFLSTDGL